MTKQRELALAIVEAALADDGDEIRRQCNAYREHCRKHGLPESSKHEGGNDGHD